MTDRDRLAADLHDELPMHWPDESPAVANGAKGAKPCRRHQWNPNNFTTWADGSSIDEPTCSRCGAVRNHAAGLGETMELGL